MGRGLAQGLPENEEATRLGQVQLDLHELYYGFSPRSQRFRFALLALDVAMVAYFIASTVTGARLTVPLLDLAIGVLLVLDLVARTLAMRRWRLQLRTPMFYLDLVVIAALFGGMLASDLAFVRVLRLVRVLRSYRVLFELRRDWTWFRRHEEVVAASVNLVVFILVTTGVVFAIERPTNGEIETFVDALYFTISTLTTTGFGDITPSSPYGRAITILIMVFGVGLFLRLIQALFRPAKVAFECTCGLSRHDLDAVHCKHCGKVVTIPSDGAV